MVLKIVALLAFVLLLPSTGAEAATLRQQFKASVAELQKNPNNQALRKKIIKLARKLKPKPAVPKEARRRLARGEAAIAAAKGKEGFRDAAKEFEKAALAAPWLAQAYYNLGVVQDKAGDYAGAIKNLKLYLLAAPRAKNAAAVEKKIFKIEYRMEKASKEEAAKKEARRSMDRRFIDHGDGTITDTKTNLMWTKRDSYADLGKCLVWNDSRSYVSRLSTGGYGDWRLPMVQELEGIYEESKNIKNFEGSTIHIDPIFASGGASSYWSSKTYNYTPLSAVFVYFKDGSAFSDRTDRCNSASVRAVRR